MWTSTFAIHGLRGSMILALFGLVTLGLPATASAQMTIEVAMYDDMTVDLGTATAMFYVGLADMTDTQGATHSSYYAAGTVTVCSSQASDGFSDYGMGGYMEVPVDPEIDDCFDLASWLSAWCSYVGPVGGSAPPKRYESKGYNWFYTFSGYGIDTFLYNRNISGQGKMCTKSQIEHPYYHERLTQTGVAIYIGGSGGALYQCVHACYGGWLGNVHGPDGATVGATWCPTPTN